MTLDNTKKPVQRASTRKKTATRATQKPPSALNHTPLPTTSDTLESLHETQKAPSKAVLPPIGSRLPWFQSLSFTRPLSEKLHNLGIHSTQQLLTHLPSRYEDLSKIHTLKETLPGTSGQFEVIIREVQSRGFGRRKSTIVQVTDGSADALIRFFNLYSSQEKVLQPGNSLRVYGEIRISLGHRELLHPRWTLTERAGALRHVLSPVYPLTAGINQAVIIRHIERVMEVMPEEILPMSLVNQPSQFPYPRLKEALRMLHQPSADDDPDALLDEKHPARQRFKLDELLALQMLLRKVRQRIRERSSIPLTDTSTKHDFVPQFLKTLPFKLTKAQQRAWEEIHHDLGQKIPMARLLQGDVGSGKTVVAILACLQALACNTQAVVMAPTEILAEQHYQRLTDWLRPLGITVGWLSSSVGKKERKELGQLVKQRFVNVVVGTHALIEDTLDFPALALAVIDEQHRFGVRQRLRLQERENIPNHTSPSSYAPHQLMMSATPIPRTLAMSHYAHLDLSVIDELPPGRLPVRTRLVNNQRRDDILRFIARTMQEGRQVYWICPLIEKSEALQLQTATQTHAQLCTDFPNWHSRIGLLHGRMSTEEKQKTMGDFAENRLSLLVSTTVIEVGVDVANATTMVIENAERFGLSQLHQLRGRVGRSAKQSVCILLFQEPLTAVARARLKVIYENTDGFEVARHDLKIRGPGEIIGDKQSGIPPLRFADIAHDGHLIQHAQRFAPLLLREYPLEAQQLINFWLSEAEILYAT